MRPNHLRQLLNAGKPSIGTHAMVSWPAVIEVIGDTGVIDYVEFVAEYAPYDLYAMENMGRAVDLFEHMSAMIKVEQDQRNFVASRAIGSGIQNVLFSDVRTVQEVEECVAAVRAETPKTGGTFGATDRRFASHGLESGSPAYVQALDDVVIALMIEKESVVKDLDAVLSVSGIDMVVFGGNDYGMSIGKPRGMTPEETAEVRTYVFKTALSKGVQPRPELGHPDQATEYTDMGIKHFTIGTDLHMLYEWLQDRAGPLRKMLGA